MSQSVSEWVTLDKKCAICGDNNNNDVFNIDNNKDNIEIEFNDNSTDNHDNIDWQHHQKWQNCFNNKNDQNNCGNNSDIINNDNNNDNYTMNSMTTSQTTTTTLNDNIINNDNTTTKKQN